MQTQTFYHTLNNNLRVVFRPTKSAVAYVGIMIGAGTRDEQKGESGMAHFIEHCLFKGTVNRSSTQIINRIEGIGGEINAYTTKEETCFYAAVPKQYVERATELLADMICNPTFPEAEVEKEKQVIFDEIETYNDSPSELIFDDFENLIFANHPLQMPILGSRRSVKGLTAQKAYQFLKRCYRTSRIVYFVMGNLSEDKVLSIADKHLSQMPYQTNADAERQQPNTYSHNHASYHKHTHQTHVMLGGPSYKINAPEQATMYFINQMLGGGSLNSRLNIALREKRGLVYTVESIYTPLSDCGYWAIYFASEPQHAEQCIDLIMKETCRLQNQLLSQTAFNQMLRQLKGQMAIAAENQENTALSLAKNTLYLNHAPTWEQNWQQVADIKVQQIQEVAQQMFDINRISILRYC